MSSEPNSLGLDFDKATISTPDAQASPAAPPPAEPTAAVTADAVETPTLSPPANDAEQSSPKGELKDKKKPYNNPDRVNTGGSQRDKLSDDALAERMARIREQNEKIRQRKLDVQADEDAFKKTQQVEAAKREKNKKVQENINRAREQNAQRKMAKVQGREWDAGKKGAVDWKEQAQQAAPPTRPAGDEQPASPVSPRGGRGGGRGLPRGGRARGRGRGGPVNSTPRTTDAPSEAPAPEAPAPASPAPAAPTPEVPSAPIGEAL